MKQTERRSGERLLTIPAEGTACTQDATATSRIEAQHRRRSATRLHSQNYIGPCFQSMCRGVVLQEYELKGMRSFHLVPRSIWFVCVCVCARVYPWRHFRWLCSGEWIEDGKHYQQYAAWHYHEPGRRGRGVAVVGSH